jgi:hypothetical protein
MFGSSCEGCEREMSFSFAYRCKDYERCESSREEGSVAPCKETEGEAILCPFLVGKSMKSGIKLGHGPDTPVQ